MRRLLFFLTLLCALPASAQFTIVTGTVTDVNGVPYACGTISAQLITAGGASPTLNGGGFSTSTSPVQLGCPTTPGSGANGSFTMRLADNTVVVPSNTTWKFTVNTTGGLPPLGTGPQTCTVTLAVSGSAQSVTGSFSACPALSNAAGGIASSPSLPSLPCTNNQVINITGNPQGVFVCINGVWVASAQGAGVVYPSSFGVLSNAQYVFDGVLNSTTTVTSNKAAFCNNGSVPCGPGRTTDVGKIFFATTGGVALQIPASVILCARTTIAAVVSATQITLTAPCANTASNVTLNWYTLDDTAWANLITYIGTLPSCPTIQMSGPGLSAISSALFTSNAVCRGNGTGGTTDAGLAIRGTGPNNSGFLIDSAFNYSSATGANKAMIGDMDSIYMADFVVYGGNFSNPAPPAGTTVFVLRIDTKMFNVQAFGLGGNAANLNCMKMLGFGQETSYLIFDGCGATSVVTSGPGNTITQSFIGDEQTQALNSISAFNGLFNGYGPNVATGPCVNFSTANGLFHSLGDFFGNCAGLGGLQIQSGSVAMLDQGLFINNINATNGILIGNGGIAQVSHSTFNVSGTGSNAFQAQTGGKISELNNQYIAGTLFATDFGSYIADGHSFAGACTGVGTAASTLALRITGTSTAGTGVPTTCTSTTLDAGLVAARNGVAYQLFVSATAAGTNASSGVVTVLKNGVAQTSTCTIGTGTSCADRLHSFSFNAGDLLSLQFTTQAADTLAGVKAIVTWGNP